VRRRSCLSLADVESDGLAAPVSNISVLTLLSPSLPGGRTADTHTAPINLHIYTSRAHQQHTYCHSANTSLKLYFDFAVRMFFSLRGVVSNHGTVYSTETSVCLAVTFNIALSPFVGATVSVFSLSSLNILANLRPRDMLTDTGWGTRRIDNFQPITRSPRFTVTRQLTAAAQTTYCV